MLHRFSPTLAVLMLTAPAWAQTGPALLLTPWPQPEAADAPLPEPTVEDEDALPPGYGGRVDPAASWSGSILWQPEADIEDVDSDLEIYEFSSRGRFRRGVNEAGDTFALGYETLYIDLQTTDDVLPDQLSDSTLALGYEHPTGPYTRWGIVGGVGYAGTEPFDDADSIYFTGDLFYEMPVDRRTTLTLLLNYDGNRAIWPDVPLPGFAFTRRLDGEGYDAVAVVGLPYSSFDLSRGDWRYHLGYSVPFSLDAVVEYELSEGLNLFGSYDSRYRGFWLEDDDNRRVFLSQQRAEAGVKLTTTGRRSVQLTAAGGYSFGQSFETGWDVRDTETLRDIDASPYVRLGLDFAF